MGFYFDVFEQYLKSSNLTSDFEDDTRFWVYNFTKHWVEVGGIYFLHRQKKLSIFLSLVSKYTCFAELEDDFEEMTQENYQLNIAAFLILTQMRLVWAANENRPWEVAFYASEVPSIISYLHAWKELLHAHWEGQPVEDAELVTLESFIKSTLAKNAVNSRHRKIYEVKEELRKWHRENRHEFLKPDGSLHQSDAAEYLCYVLKLTNLTAKKVAEYMGEFERDFKK